MIYHNLFFGLDKNELLLFNRQELLQKAKDRYHNGGGKENLLSTILKTKKFWEKTQKINMEACMKKHETKTEYGRNSYGNMKIKRTS